MDDAGIVEAAACVGQDVQPRSSKLKSTFGFDNVHGSSSFIGKVTGWIYFSDVGGYLREFICNKRQVKPDRELRENNWYVFNGLSKRYELQVNMSLDDIVQHQALEFSGQHVGISSQMNPCNTRFLLRFCHFTKRALVHQCG
jgi:hypothetical protein